MARPIRVTAGGAELFFPSRIVSKQRDGGTEHPRRTIFHANQKAIAAASPARHLSAARSSLCFLKDGPELAAPPVHFFRQCNRLNSYRH
jgi:hypothetical protein